MEEEVSKKEEEVEQSEYENHRYELYIQEQEEMIMNLRKNLFDLEQNKIKTRLIDDLYEDCEEKETKLNSEEHRK